MNSVAEIIEELRAGRMVILVDDEDRENEGDLVLAADFVTPQAINFMATEARGLICLSLSKPQIQRLGLPMMVGDERNLSPNKTAFTVSIESATGVSTGISASDRAHTIRVAANPTAKNSDIITPGHVFPICAQDGGVLKRAGHTEASVDLARMAGLNAAAVICEIMNPDGSMARVEDLKAFAQKHNLKIGTIEDLIEYRLETESFVEEVSSQPFKSTYGAGLTAHIFRDQLSGREHLAVTMGDLQSDSPVIARVHCAQVLSDVFGHSQAPSQQSLDRAMQLIVAAGRGVLIYLRNENLSSGFKTETFMDDRDYGVGAQIMRALGLRKVRMLSNHPTKRVGLKGYGIEIVDTVSLEGSPVVTKTDERAYEPIQFN